MIEFSKDLIKQVVSILKTKTQFSLLKNNVSMFGVFFNIRKQKGKSQAKY